MIPLNENIITAVIMGIGLSAACGFRVFIPMLIIGIAAKTGHIRLTENFAWIASEPAIIAFATASILEISAYYIPWLDNAMDSISAPVAVIAGTVLTSSVILDISPFFRWTLAIIAGGGAAGVVQASTMLIRAASSAITAGLGNFFISTIELLLSLIISLLAIFLPVLSLIFLILILYKISTTVWKKKSLASSSPNE